ncbi:uncharacterized protein LOC18429011 isoform X2 [Amborella trichopoda]|uniref:uncharacterized protein LOC18429011 isoform X2 n=1 Tax=Amborella trichopoda TaxID=13333 RepID=UPI0005D41B5D|nr:uncharacterized protein LOC18429011 isoform X2 [Amborella trichopoda]|eukprot:XP_011621457.1 uncharacterized protein LOC18429011 isoform X2 [Amborella trichopoda]
MLRDMKFVSGMGKFLLGLIGKSLYGGKIAGIGFLLALRGKGSERMLKFLSKVKIEFNPLDTGRTAACLEFLAQCNARRARDSNPGCQITVKRRTDNFDPQITVTFVNGTEEVIDAASTPAQDIREKILAKGRMLETEQMFREAGEAWPVMIPEAERKEPVIMGYKARKAEEKQ